MNRRALALALAAVVLLSGCDDGSEAEAERYSACIDAGGTYTREPNGQGWSCTMPGAP